MNNFCKNFISNFLRCGLTGWCLEICFTALGKPPAGNRELTGHTSLWMFPIYGCAVFLSPISILLKKQSVWVRGLSYMSLIFSAEYLSGTLLKKHKCCPWDYSHSPFHIHGLIRLDYAPFWFGTGLLFEHLLKHRPPHTATKSNTFFMH